MNIELTPDWQVFVQSLVEEGTYVSPSAVVFDALRLFKEQTDAVRILSEQTYDFHEYMSKINLYDGPTIQEVFEVAEKRRRQNLDAPKKRESP